MKSPLKFFTAALAMTTVTSVCAYQVQGQPEKGFYLVDVTSTAPLKVWADVWSRESVAPQQYLDHKCPGAKVDEINLARWESIDQNVASVQIVFVMPAQGCQSAQSRG
jgi:hypothetical protein